MANAMNSIANDILPMMHTINDRDAESENDSDSDSDGRIENQNQQPQSPSPLENVKVELVYTK
jgi:hypothetical protein